MTNEKIFQMPFAKVYSLLENKAVRKGRTAEEVQTVVTWMTGYSADEVAQLLESDTTYGEFFTIAIQQIIANSRRNGTNLHSPAE